jgi:hypothetical protein
MRAAYSRMRLSKWSSTLSPKPAAICSTFSLATYEPRMSTWSAVVCPPEGEGQLSFWRRVPPHSPRRSRASGACAISCVVILTAERCEHGRRTALLQRTHCRRGCSACASSPRRTWRPARAAWRTGQQACSAGPRQTHETVPSPSPILQPDRTIGELFSLLMLESIHCREGRVSHCHSAGTPAHAPPCGPSESPAAS